MNYNVILLEAATALLGFCLLIASLVLPRVPQKIIGSLGIVILSFLFVYSFFLHTNKDATFYQGLFVFDSLAVYFKQVFLVAGILVMAMSMGYKKGIAAAKGEFLALLVFALLGMMVMVSANDFITLYIGLELMTITMVILTAYEKEKIRSSEAGLKYLLLSAMSSGILLYGMSLLYGISGSIVFAETVAKLQEGVLSPILIIGTTFVLVGFGFKISMVPFHMWSPDVYEGAPTPITTFLAIGSKAAGFAILIRLLFQLFPQTYQAISPLLVAFAALTMLVGNLVAIPQSNMKRLLAYSSIAHAGYILLGIVAFTQVGISAMLYYLMLYVFANTGAFSAVIAVSNQTGGDTIEGLTGLWRRSPLSAWTLLVSLLSMAGIPPAAGFIGKFYLFVEIAKQGFISLAVLGIGMGVVSIYYYVKVIRTMLKGDVAGGEVGDTAGEGTRGLNVPGGQVPSSKVPFTLKAVMVVSLAMTLIMGVFPSPFINWTGHVASLLF